MRKTLLLLVVLGLAGSLWAADPNLGTWKLNLAQSKFSPGYAVPKELTEVFTAVGDQIEVTITGTAADGKPISIKATYPQGGGLAKVTTPPSASSAPLTAVITVVSRSSSYLTILKDGKQQRFGYGVVSQDGKTRRATTKGKSDDGKPVNNIEVFDKQ
jgi:hypothetical protein